MVDVDSGDFFAPTTQLGTVSTSHIVLQYMHVIRLVNLICKNLVTVGSVMLYKSFFLLASLTVMIT